MKAPAMAALALGAAIVPAISSSPCHAQIDELDAAIEAYQACLQRGAAQQDDQKSEAAAIAAAIMPMCAQEYAGEKAAWGKTFSDPVAARREFDRMDAAQAQQAVEVVLKERQDRANSR